MINRFLDWLAGVPSLEEVERQHVRDAEDRWRRHNAAARAAGCKCGRPATRVSYHHGNVGSVPVETWTCDEHEGVEAWDHDGQAWLATTSRSSPCDTCQGLCVRKSTNGGPTTWLCIANRQSP